MDMIENPKYQLKPVTVGENYQFVRNILDTQLVWKLQEK